MPRKKSKNTRGVGSKASKSRSRRKSKRCSNRRSHKKSHKKSHMKRLCDGDVCCQALTMSGDQCTRQAKIKFDMTKGTKLMGYLAIPKINCCFFCTQHSAFIAGYSVHQLGMFLATMNMDSDTYIALNPLYLDKKMKDLGYRPKEY